MSKEAFETHYRNTNGLCVSSNFSNGEAKQSILKNGKIKMFTTSKKSRILTPRILSISAIANTI